MYPYYCSQSASCCSSRAACCPGCCTAPGARSVQTYHNVKRLAKDLGITRVRVVANKIRDDGDEEFIRSAIPAEDLLGFIHYNPDIIDADRQGKSPYDFSPAAIEEIRKIKAILDRDES